MRVCVFTYTCIFSILQQLDYMTEFLEETFQPGLFHAPSVCFVLFLFYLSHYIYYIIYYIIIIFLL